MCLNRVIKNRILDLYFLIRFTFIQLIELTGEAQPALPEKINKILIVRIDRIGDFILTLPLIDNLRLKYPHASIDILVKPYLKDLAQMIPNINNVRVYTSLLKTALFIRRIKYDLAIDMMYDYRLDSAFLTFMSAAPLRAGFAWGGRELLFNRVVEPKAMPKMHMVDLHLELLRLLDVPVVVDTPRIVMKNPLLEETMIAFHPVGFYPSQRWGADNFIRLGKKLFEAYKIKLLVLGSPDDRQLVDCIIYGIENKDARPMLQNIKDTAVALSGCKLLVCNHSGPMHLAAALGVPTISMMGPADPVMWWPRGQHHIVFRKELDCSPCSKGICEKHACMELISVEEVFAAVQQLLEKVYGIRADT